MPFNHLARAKQTYTDHLGDAWYYALSCMVASVAFFIHGLYPDVFEYTGSNIIQTLDYDIRQKYRAIARQNISEHETRTDE